MKLYQAGFAVAALGVATFFAPTSFIPKAQAADSSAGITWDSTAAPPPAANAASPPGAPAGVKDANGITWNSAPPPGAPSTASRPPQNLVPPPSNAPASMPSGASASADDSGIVWNTPGAPSKAPPPGYAPPPGSGAPPGYGQPPRMAANGGPSNGQCREFQTTIVIDGQRQPAHGTVCRQPDGSWRVVNQ